VFRPFRKIYDRCVVETGAARTVSQGSQYRVRPYSDAALTTVLYSSGVIPIGHQNEDENY
jgi:hypothetical protein